MDGRSFSQVSACLRQMFITGGARSPNGMSVFGSDIAETFVVTNDRIDSFGIYFDTALYQR